MKRALLAAAMVLGACGGDGVTCREAMEAYRYGGCAAPGADVEELVLVCEFMVGDASDGCEAEVNALLACYEDGNAARDTCGCGVEATALGQCDG